jgi:hypothetical protein
MATVALCTGKSMAGDLSALRAQGVDVTSATPAALPVTGAATLLPDVSAGSASSENAWLNGFHASGFLSQTFGLWQNPSALRQFTASRDNWCPTESATRSEYYEEAYQLSVVRAGRMKYGRRIQRQKPSSPERLNIIVIYSKRGS